MSNLPQSVPFLRVIGIFFKNALNHMNKLHNPNNTDGLIQQSPISLFRRPNMKLAHADAPKAATCSQHEARGLYTFNVQKDHCFFLNCVVIWGYLKMADRLQGTEGINLFNLFLDSVFTSLFIILCQYQSLTTESKNICDGRDPRNSVQSISVHDFSVYVRLRACVSRDLVR